MIETGNSAVQSLTPKIESGLHEASGPGKDGLRLLILHLRYDPISTLLRTGGVLYMGLCSSGSAPHSRSLTSSLPLIKQAPTHHPLEHFFRGLDRNDLADARCCSLLVVYIPQTKIVISRAHQRSLALDARTHLQESTKGPHGTKKGPLVVVLTHFNYATSKRRGSRRFARFSLHMILVRDHRRK